VAFIEEEKITINYAGVYDPGIPVRKAHGPAVYLLVLPFSE